MLFFKCRIPIIVSLTTFHLVHISASAVTGKQMPYSIFFIFCSLHPGIIEKQRSVSAIVSGSSPKKDCTDIAQKSKKTTTKLGQHHRNSSPNTRYGYSTGSPTLKSELKTFGQRDSSNFTTTTATLATSTSSPNTQPSILALADTTADGMNIVLLYCARFSKQI